MMSAFWLILLARPIFCGVCDNLAKGDGHLDTICPEIARKPLIFNDLRLFEFWSARGPPGFVTRVIVRTCAVLSGQDQRSHFGPALRRGEE